MADVSATEIGSSEKNGKVEAEALELPNDKAHVGGPFSLSPFEFNARHTAARDFEQFVLPVPKEKVTLIKGLGGETMKNMRLRSKAMIKLTRTNPCGEESEWSVIVTGTVQQMLPAREMILDVLQQNVRQSPISSGYQHQGNRLCELLAPYQRYRGSSHHSQFSGYKYPQRAPYPSLNSQHPPSSDGNFPLLVAPRSHSPEEAPVQQTHPNPPFGSAPASGGHGQTYSYYPPAAAPHQGPPAAYAWYKAPVNPAAIGAPPQQGPCAAYEWYRVPVNLAAIGSPQLGPRAAYGWYKVPVNAAAIGAPHQKVPPAATLEWYQLTENPAAFGAPQQGPLAACGWYKAPVNPAWYGYGALQQQR